MPVGVHTLFRMSPDVWGDPKCIYSPEKSSRETSGDLRETSAETSEPPLPLGVQLKDVPLIRHFDRVACRP